MVAAPAVHQDDGLVRRTALLERLDRIAPDILALIAPAGFGKSTLARQFVADHGAAAVCKCARVTDEADLAQRLLYALTGDALEPHGRSSFDTAGLALRAWRDATSAAIVVFEDAEHIAGSASATEFFLQLLGERPDARRIVICSRENLRLPLSRFAAPHRVLTVRADQLAFSREEFEQLVAPLGLAEAVRDRMYELTQGWPVPVLYLARLADDDRRTGILDRLGDTVAEELRDYLADQVLGALPPPLSDVLFAAAALPQASAADLALTTGLTDAGEMLAEFGRSSPFVKPAHDGTFTLHPLVRLMLLAGAPARREALRAACMRTQRLEISLLHGTVFRGGHEIRLAGRERELLFVLARRPEALTRDRLVDLLWPDHDGELARNALKVYLHRLCRRLGDEAAIVRERDSLRLADDVSVDLWEIERSLAARGPGEIRTDADREALTALHRRLRVNFAPRGRGWEWFDQMKRAIHERRCDLARVLARDALKNGRLDDALQLAGEMIACDPCDETAREIAVAVHLAQGDRAAALRQYRQYRTVLFEELQCEPSPAITALIRD
jgi:DNA-binding SARP family transcriptional activator